MAAHKDVASANESNLGSYREIGSLICLVSSLCTWRVLSDYAFPALGHGVKVVETLILG
jgi:hypothetical protein